MRAMETKLERLKEVDARYRKARGADEDTDENPIIGTKTLADLSTGPAPDPLETSSRKTSRPSCTDRVASERECCLCISPNASQKTDAL